MISFLFPSCPISCALLSLAGLLSSIISLSTLASERLTLNFNPGWKFLQDDPAGAATPDFDDHGWTTVSTPHTYNDTDTFDDWSLPGHRGEQNQWGGRTWYRKTFNLPDSFKGKKVFIEFEAVRQVAEVYLNGHFLGVSKNWFHSLRLRPHAVLALRRAQPPRRDVRQPLHEGSEDGSAGCDGAASRPTTDATSATAFSAKVNASTPDDVDKIQADQIPWNNPHWHPAHGGIYRNVRLYVTDPLHIFRCRSTVFSRPPALMFTRPIFRSRLRPTCTSKCSHPEQERTTRRDCIALAPVDVFDAEGKSVLALEHARASIAPGGHTEFDVAGSIAHFPRLWEPAYPHLYRVVCSLRGRPRW